MKMECYNYRELQIQPQVSEVDSSIFEVGQNDSSKFRFQSKIQTG